MICLFFVPSVVRALNHRSLPITYILFSDFHFNNFVGDSREVFKLVEVSRLVRSVKL